MSTHAAIITKTKDGIYQGCYLHFDGYPANTGVVLASDFSTSDQVQKLVSMGMVESIKLGGFIKPWEDSDDAKPVFGATVEEVVKRLSVLHVYVFNGEWTYDQIPILDGFVKDPEWVFRGRKIQDAVIHDANVRYHNQHARR